MTLRQYLTIIFIATLLCWSAWIVVILNIDPFHDPGIGLAFFYLSLFLSLLGTASIVSFTVRKLFSRLALPMFRHVQRSFRDALVISILAIILLFLQSKQYLNWWNAAAFLAFIILALSFYLSTKKSPKHFSTKAQEHFGE